VFRAEYDGRLCALKQFVLVGNDVQLFRREVQALCSLDHPSVIKVEAAFLEDQSSLGFVQFPWYAGGNLDQWLKPHPRTAEEITCVMWHVLVRVQVLHRGRHVSPMQYLHAHKIVHCGMKKGFSNRWAMNRVLQLLHQRRNWNIRDYHVPGECNIADPPSRGNPIEQADVKKFLDQVTGLPIIQGWELRLFQLTVLAPIPFRAGEQVISDTPSVATT